MGACMQKGFQLAHTSGNNIHKRKKWQQQKPAVATAQQELRSHIKIERENCNWEVVGGKGILRCLLMQAIHNLQSFE